MDPYSILTGTTPEKSAEYFRMAAQSLKQNKLTLNAINFCLFYAHATGHNQQLNKRLDDLLANDKQLSEETAISLVKEHLCPDQPDKLEKLGQDFLLIMTEMMSSLVKLAEKTSHSSHKMEECVDQLSGIHRLETALPIIQTVITETRQLSDQTMSLHADLNTARAQINTLHDQITIAQQEASIDVLTGLLNRRGLSQILESFFDNDERQSLQLCLILADIDHFKNINDRYGHLTGDKVLSRIGRILVQQIKGSDSAIRYGGEEFIILLPETKLSNALIVAENIRKNIEKIILKRPRTQEIIGNISISLGVASLQEDESIETLIDRADQALYKAKNNGRNQTVIAE